MNDCGGNFNELIEVVTSYILFCEDTVTPTKQITLHPNNKKWVTKESKICLNNKKMAFLQGDRLRVWELVKEFKRKAKLAKVHYKEVVEQKLISGNAKDAGVKHHDGESPQTCSD